VDRRAPRPLARGRVVRAPGRRAHPDRLGPPAVPARAAAARAVGRWRSPRSSPRSRSRTA
jgi:hypothetical protein